VPGRPVAMDETVAVDVEHVRIVRLSQPRLTNRENIKFADA